MQNKNKILFIGKVWPEPNSSAAGKRMVQLVELFHQKGYKITFCSTAQKNEFSHQFNLDNYHEKNIKLNDCSFDEFLTKIKPDFVIFDRFMTEEQFGWRIRKFDPNTITILDTEDLHFLRHAKALAYKKKSSINYYTQIAEREIAAILRCDISLMISEKEIEVLTDIFRIPSHILHYLPFLEESQYKPSLNFEERKHCMFIGNYLHEPNYQTLLKLKKDIWPFLKNKLPNTEIHIYGSYSSQKIQQLHNTKDKFLIKGRAENAIKTMERYRILLAPIPFGAGIKGKFIDAMQSGTPSITTTIGAENMHLDNRWNGYITDSIEEFVEFSAELYNNKEKWYQAQQQGFDIIKEKFNKELYIIPLFSKLNYIKQNLQSHRNQNFIGKIMSNNQINATKYMSLWIEEKNKNK